MKKILTALTALAVATPATATEWLPAVFLDRAECNREARKLSKATQDNDVFYTCKLDENGQWRVVAGTKWWQGH